MTFCLFLAGFDQVFNINHVIKKVICSILNIYFFDVPHLYVFNGIAFDRIAFNKLLFEY